MRRTFSSPKYSQTTCVKPARLSWSGCLRGGEGRGVAGGDTDRQFRPGDRQIPASSPAICAGIWSPDERWQTEERWETALNSIIYIPPLLYCSGYIAHLSLSSYRFIPFQLQIYNYTNLGNWTERASGGGRSSELQSLAAQAVKNIKLITCDCVVSSPNKSTKFVISIKRAYVTAVSTNYKFDSVQNSNPNFHNHRASRHLLGEQRSTRATRFCCFPPLKVQRDQWALPPSFSAERWMDWFISPPASPCCLFHTQPFNWCKVKLLDESYSVYITRIFLQSKRAS